MFLNRIIESPRLEETSRNIKSNHQLTTTISTHRIIEPERQGKASKVTKSNCQPIKQSGHPLGVPVSKHNIPIIDGYSSSKRYGPTVNDAVSPCMGCKALVFKAASTLHIHAPHSHLSYFSLSHFWKHARFSRQGTWFWLLPRSIKWLSHEREECLARLPGLCFCSLPKPQSRGLELNPFNDPYPNLLKHETIWMRNKNICIILTMLSA